MRLQNIKMNLRRFDVLVRRIAYIKTSLFVSRSLIFVQRKVFLLSPKNPAGGVRPSSKTLRRQATG